MKYRILRLIALLLLVVNLSSCFEGRWAHFKNRHFYGHRRHYFKWHMHRNGDW